jgi:hypothetical protein
VYFSEHRAGCGSASSEYTVFADETRKSLLSLQVPFFTFQLAWIPTVKEGLTISAEKMRKCPIIEGKPLTLNALNEEFATLLDWQPIFEFSSKFEDYAKGGFQMLSHFAP